ncbi:MAG TPA: DUF4123 domain-containing protein [Bryobacteraceae bacterium]|nr:DUF4123 domain-containing protein [Bryobacteraceae bacterium]
MTDWKALQTKLFGAGVPVYALIDGASVPDFQKQAIENQAQYVCLYRGELTPDMAQVAPYLAHVEPEGPFMEWLLRRGWGQHWGVYALSSTDFDSLRRHFRKFLTVYDETGKPMLFRFYDPRVLGTFLPTCNSQELTSFFGPVQQFVLEGKRPEELLEMSQAGGKLKERMTLMAPAI